LSNRRTSLLLLVYLHFAIVLAQTFGVVGRVLEVHLVFNLSDNVGFSAIVPCEPVLIIREALIFYFRVLLHFFMNLLFKALGTRAMRFSIDFRIFSYAFVIRRATFFTRSGFSYARSLKNENIIIFSWCRMYAAPSGVRARLIPRFHLIFAEGTWSSALPPKKALCRAPSMGCASARRFSGSAFRPSSPSLGLFGVIPSS